MRQNSSGKSAKKKYVVPTISKFDLSKKDPFSAACKKTTGTEFTPAVPFCTTDCETVIAEGS